MRLAGCCTLVLLLTLSPVAAQLPEGKPVKPTPEGKILKDAWEAAFLEGNQAGFIHSLVREVTLGDQKLIEVTQELDLTVTRFGQTLRLNFVIGNHETPEGKVVAVVLRQELSKDQRQVVKGKVVGKELHYRIEQGANPPVEKKTVWNDKVLGLYAQELLFKGRKLEPNTRFDYYRFESVFAAVFRAHVEIKDFEEVTFPGGPKRRLLRTETSVEKVQNVELPKAVLWVDADGEPVKSQTELPGLGQLVTYRTTMERATAKPAGKPTLDVGISQLIRLRTPIARAGDAREIVYRVRLKGLEEPETAFAKDDRQAIKKTADDVLEITTRGPFQPAPADKPTERPADYLKSNHFIRSADERVRALARQATADEADPWQQALKVTRWVRQNLKNKNFSEAFASADRVARSLEGDCTEHSVLAAAMCRAAGVPARTAVGLVYVPQANAMGYHMWIEVWVAGQWYALDPTFGDGAVGPTYLKISDHHWNDVHSVLPLLSVVRILGKVQIEVVRVTHDGNGAGKSRAR